nr:PREDICTED: uncharacterized protein LOC103992100 [Musa acuminata subsp. malaccensis]
MSPLHCSPENYVRERERERALYVAHLIELPKKHCNLVRDPCCLALYSARAHTPTQMKANGFLCRSHVDAVCIPGDPRSMIMPRRPDRTLAEHSRLVDLKYSRLVDSRRFNSGERSRAVTLPMVTKKQREPRPAKTTTATGTVPSRPPSNDHVFQVVVMRVSIHCQGCAGKVRKHISKMEGVTSFSIDLESKRVIVMGHVSPVGVLESISKVKKAELWPC